MIGGKSPLIHLRTNRIPRGLIPLEKLFDKYNVFMGTNKSNLDEQVLEVNIGLDKSPRNIKLQGKGCMHEKKRKLESFGRECKDVFAWSYDELKTYDPKVITHAIPFREYAKPLKQHQRHMNHKLSAIIMRELHKLLEAHIIILSCIQIGFPHCTCQKKNGEI